MYKRQLFSRAETAARLRRAGTGNAGAEGRLARVGRALKIIFESYVKGNTKSGTQVDGGSVLVDGHGRLGIDEFFGRGPCVASRRDVPFVSSPTSRSNALPRTQVPEFRRFHQLRGGLPNRAALAG